MHSFRDRCKLSSEPFCAALASILAISCAGCEKPINATYVQATNLHGLSEAQRQELVEIVDHRLRQAKLPAVDIRYESRRKRLSIRYQGDTSDEELVQWLASASCTLELRIEGGSDRSILGNADIIRSSPTGGSWNPSVQLELSSAASSRLYCETSRNVGKNVALSLDGNVTVIAPILGPFGSPFVFTVENRDDARVISACLSGKPLPSPTT